MPIWNDLRLELNQRQAELGLSASDIIRREQMKAMADHTGRPLIVYAAEFMNQIEKARLAGSDIQIALSDKEGFIEVMENLPPGPLDLILHSAGGNPLAAESIVSLLRSKFDHIRVFVPNVAKSAATMLALSGDVVAMDERGELGPIDPQMIITRDQQTIVSPAQGILDEFERAREEVQKDQGKLPGWLPILRQYGPSLLVEAENAIELSKQLVQNWLVQYMFKDDSEREAHARAITSYFGDHNNFRSHGRMVGISEVTAQGVKVLDLRTDPELRRLVWRLYTAISLTLDRTSAFKLIENNLGQAYIRLVQQVQIAGQPARVAPPTPTEQPMSRQQRRAEERAQAKRK